MTYSAVYCALITKRLQNPITKDDCYCETHHIIPKSEGGTNESDNLVNLTAREHYIAHRLLAHIYDDEKMWLAISFLSHSRNGQRYVPSRVYQLLREKISHKKKGKKLSMKTRLKMSKSHVGKASPNKGNTYSEETRRKISIAGYGRKHTEETRRKISLANKGRISSMKGRRFSEGHKRRISEALKGHKSHVLGKKKYTNGIIKVYAFECPEGFRPVKKVDDGGK